jgi:hypothetical protein
MRIRKRTTPTITRDTTYPGTPETTSELPTENPRGKAAIIARRKKPPKTLSTVFAIITYVLAKRIRSATPAVRAKE